MKKLSHGEPVEVTHGKHVYQARYVAPFPDGVYSHKVYEHIVVDQDTGEPLVVSDRNLNPVIEEDGA